MNIVSTEDYNEGNLYIFSFGIFQCVCWGGGVNISAEAHRDHRVQIPLELITGNS